MPDYSSNKQLSILNEVSVLVYYEITIDTVFQMHLHSRI